MPWCPKCKIEYQEGITKCIDCGANLVDTLSDDNGKHKAHDKEKQKDVFLVNVFGPVEFSYITSMLEEAEIPYRVSEDGSGNYMGIFLGHSFAGQNILVGEDDYDRAAEIVASYQNSIAEEEAPDGDDTADDV